MGKNKVLTIFDEEEKFCIDDTNEIPICVLELLNDSGQLNDKGLQQYIRNMRKKIDELSEEIDNLRNE